MYRGCPAITLPRKFYTIKKLFGVWECILIKKFQMTGIQISAFYSNRVGMERCSGFCYSPPLHREEQKEMESLAEDYFIEGGDAVALHCAEV